MHDTYEYNTSWEKVRRLFPEGTGLSILDIGCGDGSLLQGLVDDHEVFGLDESAEAVKKAYSRGINAVKGSLVDPLPFPTDQFDIVLALDVLEHVYDIPYAIEEIKRVVKDTGYIIISVPNHFDMRTRIDILRGKGIIRWSQRNWEKKSWEYSHIRFMNLKEMRMLLAEQGVYIDREQFNFMSGGLLPTRFIPKAIRVLLIKLWPGAWSGKLVFRCRLTEEKLTRIIISKTPKDF